jgi:hypothetical protein
MEQVVTIALHGLIDQLRTCPRRDRTNPRGPRALSTLKRVGIRSTDFITASRHRRRVNRPDTWLHPTTRRRNRFSSCTLPFMLTLISCSFSLPVNGRSDPPVFTLWSGC